MSFYLQAYQEDESQPCGGAVLNDKFNIKLDSDDEFVIALGGKTVSNARENYTYKSKIKRNHSRYRRI